MLKYIRFRIFLENEPNEAKMSNVESSSVEYTYIEDANANVVKILIDLNTIPQQLTDCNSWHGYYCDQIAFFTLEPGAGEQQATTILVIIHIGINPRYDDAAATLLGDTLWELMSDDNYDDMNARHALRQDAVLTDEEAQAFVNRLMYNSTFSS